MSEGRRRSAADVAPHDWSRYGLAQIWAMLEPQSRQHGVIAAGAWSKMQRLCTEEADALEGALARLAERWPLTQEAAVAFQEWGAHLVAAMRGTSDVAAINGPVVDSITYEIDRTRQRVAELRAEAAEYQAIEVQHGRGVADAAFHARYVGGQAPLTRLEPWRDGLDRVAQQMMAQLEAAVAEHHPRIAHDTPYASLNVAKRDPGQEHLEPPDRQRRETWTVDPRRWEPTPTPEGTVLDEVRPMPSGLPSSTDSRPSSGGSGPGGRMGTGGGGLGDRGSSFVDTPGGRVLAPGGVIGPLGGAVPAGGSGVGRPAGPGMVPIAPPTMSNPAGAGQGGPRRSARRGLPNVFEVPKAPPAVIVPPEEPKSHEPGPGVFGIDR